MQPRVKASRPKKIKSVFLNIPYDAAFETLYLAYIVGLTQLGLKINAAIAVPNQDRLHTIIGLIEQSNFSIHDLSRIEASGGIPRRTQRSTSDVNGIDPQIHHGTPRGLMSGLRISCGKLETSRPFLNCLPVFTP